MKRAFGFPTTAPCEWFSSMITKTCWRPARDRLELAAAPTRRRAARRAVAIRRRMGADPTRQPCAAAPDPPSWWAMHLLVAAFAPVSQQYVHQARQMQALSLGVHIPLVCFGIALPALVLFCEWRSLRTGDSVYRTLARRWSKIMLALFAVGVVTGTILSFELGLLWPGFMATFGNVFGLGFTLEGFSFFLEAIFIGIYVYGWDRLSPRMHILSAIPIIITGFSGSLMVIAVNGWMNHPSGFTLQDGRAVDVHPWSALFGNSHFWHEFVHMYFAGYIVTGFLVATPYAWGFLRGRRGRYERTALAVALSSAAIAAPLQVIVGDSAARDVARTQPVKLASFEGL